MRGLAWLCDAGEERLFCALRNSFTPSKWKAIVFPWAVMLARGSDSQGAAAHCLFAAAAPEAIFCPGNLSKGVQSSIQDTACIRQQQIKTRSFSLHVKAERFKNYFKFSENVFLGNSKVEFVLFSRLLPRQFGEPELVSSLVRDSFGVTGLG